VGSGGIAAAGIKPGEGGSKARFLGPQPGAAVVLGKGTFFHAAVPGPSGHGGGGSLSPARTDIKAGIGLRPRRLRLRLLSLPTSPVKWAVGTRYSIGAGFVFLAQASRHSLRHPAGCARPAAFGDAPDAAAMGGDMPLARRSVWARPRSAAASPLKGCCRDSPDWPVRPLLRGPADLPHRPLGADPGASAFRPHRGAGCCSGFLGVLIMAISGDIHAVRAPSSASAKTPLFSLSVLSRGASSAGRSGARRW